MGFSNLQHFEDEVKLTQLGFEKRLFSLKHSPVIVFINLSF